MPALMLSDSGTSLLRNVQCSLSSACFLGGGRVHVVHWLLSGWIGHCLISVVSFWVDRTLAAFWIHRTLLALEVDWTLVIF